MTAASGDMDIDPPLTAQGSVRSACPDLVHNFDHTQEAENIIYTVLTPDAPGPDMDIDVDADNGPPTSSNPGAACSQPSIRRGHPRRGRPVTTSITQPTPSDGGNVLGVPTNVEFVDEAGRIISMDLNRAQVTREDVVGNKHALEKGRDIALAVLQTKVRL